MNNDDVVHASTGRGDATRLASHVGRDGCEVDGRDTAGVDSGAFEVGGVDATRFDNGGFDAGGFDAGGFDIDSARRLWQLAELERAVLSSLAQNRGIASLLHALAAGLERIAAPGTLASILIVDDGEPPRLRHGAASSLPSAYVAKVDGQAIGPSAGSCGTAAWRRSRVIVSDIATDPLWEAYREEALASGLRACWSVPILSTQADVLGTFAFYYRERRTPEPGDLLSIEAAARLARIVLERERADHMSRRSARRDRALLAAARVLASEEGVPVVMEQLLAAVGEALSWQAGVVWSCHAGSNSFQLTAAWSTDPARFKAFLADASRQPLLRGARQEARSLVSTQRFVPPARERPSPVCAAAAAGVRRGLGIPIQAGDDAIGWIELFTTADETIEPELESTLHSVGLQMGQFCRRARAQADRQRLIAELRETLRFSELFASILAHDLRNPLSTLSMGTQLLAKGLLAKEAAPGPASILQRMQNSATRMSRMIEQLLDLTRSREGCGLALHHEALQLGELASAAVHELVIAYPDARVELQVEGDTSGSWDRDRLAQVLSNLIGNAIEHGDTGGPVRVRVRARDAEWVALETHNLGSIAPEGLATLFDPFKRARPAVKRSRGLGLGLYITRLIVTEHGGSIQVCSDGEGTRFDVQLPRAPGHGTLARRTNALPPASENAPPETRR